MLILSQNKKIAVAALAIFIVSFSVMMLFLGYGAEGGKGASSAGHANVFSHDISPSSEEHGSPEGEEEKTHVEAVFDELEGYYRGIIEIETGPMVVLDRQWQIQYSSEDFCKLLTVKCGDIFEESLFNLIVGEDHGELSKVSVDLVEGGERVDAIGPVRVRKGVDSKENVLALLSAKVVKEEGETKAIIINFKDLSEKVEDISKKGEKIGFLLQ